MDAAHNVSGETGHTKSHLDVLAYTATHGEAEEDRKAPSPTETSAEQQSE